MANQEYPTLEGYAPSWADISATFTANGGEALQTPDFNAINTGTKIEFGEQRGASGGRVLAQTTGSATHEGTITFYRSGYRKLIKSLLELAPRRGNEALVSLVKFDISIKHTPEGEVEIYERRITGCRVLTNKIDMKEGNDADLVEVEIKPFKIADIINGVEVVLL